MDRRVIVIVGGACSALLITASLIWWRGSPATVHDVVVDESDAPAPARSAKRQLPLRRILALPVLRDSDEAIDPDDAILAADGGASRYASDDDGLDAAIDDLEPKVQRCYQDVLDLEPGVRGMIEVSFVLIEGNGAGRLDHVQVVDGGVDNPALTSCIADRISELAFDAPEVDIELTVPFEFVTDDAERDPNSPSEPDFVELPPPPPDGQGSSTGG